MKELKSGPGLEHIGDPEWDGGPSYPQGVHHQVDGDKYKGS